MARHLFASSADYVITPGVDNVATLQVGVTVTCWNAISGGTQITDLTEPDGATPIPSGQLTTDTNGSLPEFMGPDGVTWVYLDASDGSGPRERAVATDIGPIATALEAQVNGGGGLAERLATAEDNIDSIVSGAAQFPWMVVVDGFDDTAVQAAIGSVLGSLSGSRLTKPVIVFPPGTYSLTQPLIRPDATSLNMIEGLQVVGAGIGSTVIQYNNSTLPFINASDPRLRFVKISGMTVDSQNSAARFAYLFSTQGGQYNQRWHMSDLKFGGTWASGFQLDGGSNGNLNSEFTFERVETNPSSVWTDAFFHSGLSNHSTENQFLNYWFYDCNFSLSSGTALRWTRGGAVTIINGSWSANSSSNSITWLDFPSVQSNAPDRHQVYVCRVRFEPKGSAHKVLSSSAADGFFHFESCSDNGSSQNSASYVHERYTINGNNIWGGNVAPILRFTNGSHGGIVKYAGGAQTRGGIIVDGCKVYRGDLGQRAYGPQTEAGASVGSSAANPFVQWSSGAPNRRFTNCWNVQDSAAWTQPT